jgi:hypothetical protein
MVILQYARRKKTFERSKQKLIPLRNLQKVSVRCHCHKTVTGIVPELKKNSNATAHEHERFFDENKSLYLVFMRVIFFSAS